MIENKRFRDIIFTLRLRGVIIVIFCVPGRLIKTERDHCACPP